MKKTIAGLAAALACSAAFAQYPNKPIHIIVPSAPGDGSDLTARLISDKLSTALGHVLSNAIDAAAGAEIAAALKAAEVAPWPDPASAYEDVMNSGAGVWR